MLPYLRALNADEFLNTQVIKPLTANLTEIALCIGFFFFENFIVMSLFALFTSSSSKLNETLRQKMNLNNKNRELTFLAGYVAKFHMMLRLSGMSWNNVRRAKVKNRQYLRSS